CGNLVADYNFDSTSITDSSNYGNDGTNHDATAVTTGCISGNCLNFNGASYIEVPYSPSLGLNTYTVSAWVKLNNEPGTYGVLGTRFGGENTFDFKIRSTDIHGDIGTGSVPWLTTEADCGFNVPVNVPVNVWTNIVYVVYPNGYKVYRDGTSCSEGFFSGTPLLMKSGQTMRIGNSWGNEYMDGIIDEVQIYNRVLDNSEIQLYYEGLAPGDVADEDGDGVLDSVDVCNIEASNPDYIFTAGDRIGCLFGDADGNGCLTTIEFLPLMYYYQKIDDPNTVACLGEDNGDCLTTVEFLSLMYYYQKIDDPNTVACGGS
ncbi:MAG: LamG domain-containing protein, partial [Nanoarchaeota archaeon]|nr:LamG domain-containing protein [Nanoarchaeota archaeon]